MNEKKSIEYKSIDLLHFDPQNPRLPSTVNSNNEQAVLEWLLGDANIIELMLSIGEKGYFQGEALLVVPHEKLPNNYRVIEGNRRLTAVKLLRNPQLASIRKKSVEQASSEAKYKLDELPVVIFNKREDILTYLGYRHITGIKTWGALAKAKYLAQLLTTLGDGEKKEKYKMLAKIIGSRADHVGRTLAGLAVYEKIVDEGILHSKGLNEESLDFSILTTALSYQHIPKFIGMEDTQDEELKNLKVRNLDDLTSWLFEKNSENKTRLGESRNLGKLNSVIGNSIALEKFRGGESLDNAVLYTEVPTQIFQNAILEAKSRLELARNYIHIVDKPSKTHSETLREVQSLARLLWINIEDKLMESREL